MSRPSTSSGNVQRADQLRELDVLRRRVGTHQLRFTVTDSAGMTASCTVSIVVNPLGDLRVELTWNRNNDMDLHLQHSSAGNPSNRNNWGITASPLDCYYGNLEPLVGHRRPRR